MAWKVRFLMPAGINVVHFYGLNRAKEQKQKLSFRSQSINKLNQLLNSVNILRETRSSGPERKSETVFWHNGELEG